MNIKPKFVYYDIRRKQSVCLTMYTHENDVDTQVLEVSMLDDGEPIELDADYTYSAAIINRETKELINNSIESSLNDSGNVEIPVDNFHQLGAQDLLIELTITDSEGNQVLVTPFPLWIHVNASILDDAQVTPDSLGTIPDLLREAVEAVRSYSNLTDKPTINGITVEGNLTSADFALRDGKSAYEIAVENGFSGTEQQWLQSLKGADGAQGPQGAQGERGEKGDKGDKGDTGDTGTEIQGAAVNASGHLIVTLTDQTSIDCGAVRGADGVSVTNAEINASGHLILTLSSGSTIDAGYIGSPSIDISSAIVTLSASSFTYDSTSKAPSVTSVVLNGTTLTEWTDYVVVAASATNAGSYTLTVNGIGDYTGTVTANWSIAKAQAVISGDSTITISENDSPVSKTYTSDSDGAFSFSISDNTVASISNSGGTVTVTPLTVGTATITVTLAEGTNYLGATKTVALTVSQAVTRTVFGVCWDYSLSSPVLTRLTPQTDPLDVVTNVPSTEPTACVGSTGGQSDFDNYMPWSGMVRKNYVNGQIVDFTGYDNGETYVYIPEFWSKIVDDSANSKMYFYISSGALTGFTKHLGSDRYVARYACNSNFKSESGSAPKSNTSLGDFRTGITAIDNKHYQYDIHVYAALELLYIVEWANFNSQTKIGKGSRVNSNTGGSDVLTYHTGRVGGNDTSSSLSNQYHWIENLWGNMFTLTDGVLVEDRLVYICNDFTKYSDSEVTNYDSTELYLPSSGWYSIAQIYHNGYLFPKATTGSDTTYFCDYCWTVNQTDVKVLITNGSSDTKGGMFFWDSSRDTNDMGTNIGSRSILILGGDS